MSYLVYLFCVFEFSCIEYISILFNMPFVLILHYIYIIFIW